MTYLSNAGRRKVLKQMCAIAVPLAVPQLMAFSEPPAADRAMRIKPARMEDGFRPLFDGHSLAGWKRQPRELKDPSLGLWTVQNGMIVGAQEKPKVGSYLTTEETFSDFELEIESWTDFPTDTGVLVRTNQQGNLGLQVCIDYRPHGALNGYYGNGIGGFHACNYCFTATRNENGKVIGLVPEKPSEPLDTTHLVALDYAPSAASFLRSWHLHGWNRYRIRSVGAVPHLTTWVNGLKVAELNTAKMISPGWDPMKVDALVGRAGHIALEVHSNGPKDWLGDDRWQPGAVCRWRNIFVKTL
jgi:hypothetical protein